MHTRRLHAVLWIVAAAAGARAQVKGVTLEQLSTLAKTLAEKVRPELEKKLEPFIEVLSKRRRDNMIEVDAKIAEVVQIGGSIVPLLLEKLDPERGGTPSTNNLADNCELILARMDPSSFADPLIDIAESGSFHAVRRVIPLLGQTGDSRAGDVLTRLFDREKDHRLATVLALTELKHKGAALKVAQLLPMSSPAEDRVAADYLRAVAAPAVVPEVLRALDAVKRSGQIMRYLGILRTSAKADGATAEKLLPLLDNNRLDRSQQAELMACMAVIAPEEHGPTIDRLHTWLKKGGTDVVDLQAALALRDLGDKEGPAILRKNLIAKTRGAGRRNYLNHDTLGDFYLAFGEHKSAIKSYRLAIQNATGAAVRALIYLKIARAEAYQERWRSVADAFRDSKANYERLMQEAREYPVLAEAMKQKEVKKFMDAFGQDR